MAGERTLPGLGLTAFWNLGSDDWKPGMDENMRKLSALTNLKVLNAVATLPGSPTNGDIYLVTSGAETNKIAIRDNGAWVYLTPAAGWRLFDATAGAFKYFNGSAWVNELPTLTNTGGLTLLSVADASSSSVLDFTGLDGTYSAYLFELCQLVFSNSGVTLSARVQQSAAWNSTTGAYKSHRDYFTDSSGTLSAMTVEGSSQTYFQIAVPSTVSGEVASGQVILYPRSGLYPTIRTDVVLQKYQTGTVGLRGRMRVAGAVDNTAQATGLRIYPSVGVITSGKVMCYGLRSSV